MHIINAMFGKGKGGIEQAFVDYSKVLIRLGYETTALIHPDAEIKEILINENIPFIEIKNKGVWDIFAVGRLKKAIKDIGADIAICHGNRAINLIYKAGVCKVIGVAHNYKIKRFGKLETVITVSKKLKRIVEKLGVKNVFHIPNMIEVMSVPPIRKSFNSPVVIGTMGRFVHKKGFADFINAISILSKEVDIKVKIAGDGELKEELKQQVKELGLDNVEFLGWVKNKEKFYNDIDIFCLPSLEEPFGIVMLEAFVNALPIVSTDARGPSEVITSGKDGIIVPKNNPAELADGLKKLVLDENKARELGRQGYITAKENYSVEAVSKRIDEVLKKCC